MGNKKITTAVVLLLVLSVDGFAQKPARKELPIIAGRSVHFLDETNAEAIAKASPLFGDYNEWSSKFTDYKVNGAVFDIVKDDQSYPDVYIAGSFDSVGGQSAGRIAKYSRGMDTVIPFANGITSGSIYSLLVISDTNLYAAGWFTIGASAEHVGVAHWNGKTWTAVGPAPDSTVLAIALFNGQIYIGGNFRHIGSTEANYIATYDVLNRTWAAILDGTTNGFDGGVATFCISPNGMYAGGGFFHAGAIAANRIAFLATDDSIWHPIGSGVTGDNSFVTAITYNHTWGSVSVCGQFDSSGRYDASNFGQWSEQTQDWMANQPRFNGTTYDALAESFVLFVVGDFTKIDTFSVSNIANSGVKELGGGIDGPGYALVGNIYFVALQHVGEPFYVGGRFNNADGKQGRNFAIYYSSFGREVHSTSADTRELTISPNPATTICTITLPESAHSLIVCDALGRIVMQLGTNQLRGDEATIDTHSLNEGYYTVACQSAEGLYHASLIIRK